ncbi:MAG: hypothetical protein AAFR46_06650 [Pseudomonadota bacterium]
MSFSALRKGQVVSYIESHRRGIRRWFLHHVPKTAGSSLADEFAERLPPYWNLTVAYDAETGSTHDQMDRAVERFIAAGPQTWRSASGHVMPRHIDRIAETCADVGFITFLRHPIARIVSEYRYCRTESHPPYRAFIERYPTIEDFVADPREANKMSLYLFGQRDVSVEAAMARLRTRYAFVGLQERYPLSFRMMSILMWGGSSPQARSRVTSEDSENRVELTPELTARILEANALDLAIYRAVFELYAEIAEEAWTLEID